MFDADRPWVLRSGTAARAAIISHCAEISPALADRLRGAPLLFFDGTLFTDDEMIRQASAPRPAGAWAHAACRAPDGSIGGLKPLGIGRKIFIHINNTNPVLLDGFARAPRGRGGRLRGRL